MSSNLYFLELEFLVSVCWNHEKYKIRKLGIKTKSLFIIDGVYRSVYVESLRSGFFVTSHLILFDRALR